MLIGYARVSTEDQDTTAQVAALKAAGCARIFREKASGRRWDLPQLLRLLDQLRAGDVIVLVTAIVRKHIYGYTFTHENDDRYQ